MSYTYLDRFNCFKTPNGVGVYDNEGIISFEIDDNHDSDIEVHLSAEDDEKLRVLLIESKESK